MPEMRESANPRGQALGVILCLCPGATPGRTSLEEVGEFLQRRYPKASVHILDNLCARPEEVARVIRENGLNRLVIGGCKGEEYKESFQAQAKGAGLDPFGLEMVNLRDTLCNTARPGATGQTKATAKAQLLMAAAMERAMAFSEVEPEGLRPRFGKREGKFSRRAFFSIARIRYDVVPSLDMSRCFADMGCRLCLASCPYSAIGEDSATISINKSRCEGCGQCIPTCPRDAIKLPTFTPAQIDGAMRALLSFPEIELGPRAIMLVCPGSKLALADLDAIGFTCPPGLLPLEVPCLGMVTPALALKALALGAAGVILLPCPGQCRHFLNPESLNRKVAFLQTLMESLGHGHERISGIYSSSEDPPGLAEELAKTAERMGIQGPLGPVPWEQDAEDFGSLALALGDTIELSVRSPESPLGLVTLNPEKCTSCGLCAARCPTEALAFQETPEGTSLTFRHRACVGCGMCASYCPEKEAIRVEKGLDLGELRAPARVLLADEMARCPGCGQPSIPNRLATKIEQELLKGAGSESVARAVRYCPDCRSLARFPL